MTEIEAVKILENNAKDIAGVSEVIEYLQLQNAVIDGLRGVLNVAVADINKYCRSCKICKKYSPVLICDHDGPGDGCFFYRGSYPRMGRVR